MSTKVLIIEDAADAAESVKAACSDCTTIAAPPGNPGLQAVVTESPDLVILDLGPANGKGMSFLNDIRRVSDVPLLMIGAVAGEADRIRSLELGADDYVVKPFSPAEFRAHIHAVLRRSRRPDPRKNPYQLEGDNFSIDLAAGRVYVGGQEKEFSATEWKLLSYLVRHAGTVISNQTLTRDVWGLNVVEDSTIKMCVRRVRLKLGDDTQAPRIIRSYRGRGYCFELHQ